MMGAERTPCYGILDMKVISSASTSRLFRSLLLFMSILFLLLFVYQNTKSSRLSRPISAQDTQSMRKHTHPRKLVSIDPYRLRAKDQTNRWIRRRKKITQTANKTVELGTSRLEEIKQGMLVTRSMANYILERTQENTRIRNVFADSERMREAQKLQNRYWTQVKDEFVRKDYKYDENSEDVVKDESTRPIYIVILARMRTGSTLLGEIFNQNPSLFFIYEPLISIDPLLRSGDVDVSEHRNISSDLLLSYSRCEFRENLTRTWLRWNGGSVRNNKIISLCKKPPGPKNRYRNCSAVTVDDMRNVCRQSHQRVCIKTIRADLDYFKPLVDAGINVKIIHLVRDPRGTANSRRLYYNFSRPKLPPRIIGNVRNVRRTWKGKLDDLGLLGDYPDHVVHTIPRLCQWTRDSILQVQNEKPSWLRNRYKLVRYEDFALDPLRAARQIYDFVGLEFPRAVKEWIVSNTRFNDQRSVKLFSTHKNSIETALRWRQALRPLQVRQVEEICPATMKLLGYKKVESIMDIANINVSLMEPLSIPDTF